MNVALLYFGHCSLLCVICSFCFASQHWCNFVLVVLKLSAMQLYYLDNFDHTDAQMSGCCSAFVLLLFLVPRPGVFLKTLTPSTIVIPMVNPLNCENYFISNMENN